MNKYQEVLNNMCCGCYGGDEGCNQRDKYCLRFLTLQELINRNQKLEKVIQILKEHIDVYIYFGQSTINIKDYGLIQEEYDLLKEVLEDDK